MARTRILVKVLDINLQYAGEMAVRIVTIGKLVADCRQDIPAALAGVYPWLPLFTKNHIF